MCGEMVQATLREVDPKWQTRRIVKPQPKSDKVTWGCLGGKGFGFFFGDNFQRCPYGETGDRLWVKETFGVHKDCPAKKISDIGVGWICYRADGGGMCPASLVEHWKPSIFMSRKLSRITLELTKIRVERVRDITEVDAITEGCRMKDGFPEEQPDKSGIGNIGWDDPVEWYSWLWDSLNAKRDGGIYAWDKNPWVWVLEFKKV